MKKIRYRFVYNRRKHLNTQGTALIQVEASLPKRKIYFSTRIYVRPDEWDYKTSSVVNHPHAFEYNAWIYEFKMQLENFELAMWKRGKVPTLLQLKEAVSNGRSAELSFDAFGRSAVEKSKRSKGTKSNLLGTLTMLSEFKPGYNWEDLSYSFLKELELYLIDKKAAINTIAKHMRNIRTIVGEAISQGYMSADDNPFKSFKVRHEKVAHRYLNPDELKKMESVKLDGKLAHVRDAFLFCCYTGLRFSDFRNLREDNFIKQKGQIWLHIKTQKTGSGVKIPLSLVFEGKALAVLSKYSSVPLFSRLGCNADTNRHLAEIQRLAKIKMRTTFHTARHTCATLLCHQGVPITTVQRILGHSKLTTTQLYSEIMADTIVRDLTLVRKYRNLEQ